LTLLDDAINILLTNDLEYFSERVPAGTTPAGVLKLVIERIDGVRMDYIAKKHFGLTRNQWSHSYETDIEFRSRILFSLSFSDQNQSCTHSWTTYDSGWSTYKFCSKCDLKKT
jgi:hypothetical protein